MSRSHRSNWTQGARNRSIYLDHEWVMRMLGLAWSYKGTPPREQAEALSPEIAEKAKRYASPTPQIPYDEEAIKANYKAWMNRCNNH